MDLILPSSGSSFPSANWCSELALVISTTQSKSLMLCPGSRERLNDGTSETRDFHRPGLLVCRPPRGLLEKVYPPHFGFLENVPVGSRMGSRATPSASFPGERFPLTCRMGSRAAAQCVHSWRTLSPADRLSFWFTSRNECVPFAVAGRSRCLVGGWVVWRAKKGKRRGHVQGQRGL